MAPAAAKSSSGMDEPTPAPASIDHLVAVAGQLVHAGRGDGHPVLVVLDLPRDADHHCCSFPTPGSVAGLSFSLPARPHVPQTGEAVLAGGVGGQEADDGNAIMQVTGQHQGDRAVQRHPVQYQVRLFVFRHEIPVGHGHLFQAAGQEDPEPLGE